MAARYRASGYEPLERPNRVVRIEGVRFSHLTALRTLGQRKRKVYWLCSCDCGNEAEVESYKLRSGHTRSCGCLVAETAGSLNLSHGDARVGAITPEFKAWQGMKERCLCETNHAYGDYGGRGIKVCDRWLNDFPQFLRDMGRRPSPDHSLDRRKVDGDYEPSNCRWATRLEQNCNRRNTPVFTVGGLTAPFADLCRHFGQNFKRADQRMRALDWSAERAVLFGARNAHLATHGASK